MPAYENEITVTTQEMKLCIYCGIWQKDNVLQKPYGKQCQTCRNKKTMDIYYEKTKGLKRRCKVQGNYKTCSNCYETKEINTINFYDCDIAKGEISTCRNCKNKRANVLYKEKRSSPRVVSDYKICRKCGQEKLKNEDNFYLVTYKRKGKTYTKFMGPCRECNVKILREKRTKKREALFKKLGIPYVGYDERYCEDCGTVKKYNNENFQIHKNKSDKYYNSWAKKCKSCRQRRQIEKYNSDPVIIENRKLAEEKSRIWKIKKKIRRHVSHLVFLSLKKNGGSKKGQSVMKFLGYTLEELKLHFESLFEWWMTWENYGPYRIKEWDENDPSTWKWSIDHIKPICSFNYTTMDEEEFKQCWAISNLRPLSAKQNVLDGFRGIR